MTPFHVLLRIITDVASYIIIRVMGVKRTGVAICMKDKLIKLNRKNVWYGDVQIIEECAAECGIKKPHPRQTIAAVLNALDKSSLFSKTYLFADINGSRKKYRCFSITEKAED